MGVELAKASQLLTGTKGRPCLYVSPTAATFHSISLRAFASVPQNADLSMLTLRLGDLPPNSLTHQTKEFGPHGILISTRL